ncbi:LytR/AlgR family response regulator transcription factor [Nocardia huaxiensis]|uniref:LytR/AlgR family response regulator transcription factor n=1 Tax=Nocardia huaxiensis TaxID=2755382 RepID=UPI001E50B53B|nr:LytTR family DNA-binding domain-containing protein [Nocardia huaxiensis]UFS96975.1 LytTR family DNA-binding domain-containing protein [Nocardia huaxiensis]
MTPTTAPGPGALRVLAVDDEQPALDELVYLLRAQPEVGDVRTAPDATTALRLLRAHDIDAVFLDINMPGLDGMELAGILAAFANPPAVVFVTAHDDRAVAAFEIGATDYLLKPLREARLAEAVRRITAARADRRPATDHAEGQSPADSGEVIPVELGGVTTLVERSGVTWVEAEGDYARLHTATGAHLVRIPLSVLESRWSEAGFVRIHRSYLIALRMVTGLRTVGTGTVVCLRAEGHSPAIELPVARRQVRDLKQRLVHRPRKQTGSR